MTLKEKKNALQGIYLNIQLNLVHFMEKKILSQIAHSYINCTFKHDKNSIHQADVN